MAKRPVKKRASKSAKGPTPSATATLNDDIGEEKRLEMWRLQLEVRHMEQRLHDLFFQNLIKGTSHLAIGQEAIASGCAAVMRPDDYTFCTYRGHAHTKVRGVSMEKIIGEMMGKGTGLLGGKGGSMHMFSRGKKFFGGHGIVGAQVPIGVGLAFSHKYKDEPNVCLTYLGDGAVNQGQVYESFNMAALWGLPCLFIIENNQYGMGTAVTRAAAGRALADRGLAYGIPGKQVDGMDVLAVREAAQTAVAHCRTGKGPFVLEMQTYRYRGHSMSDPAKYRTREEVDAMRKQHDPIDQIRDLLKNQHVDDAQLKEIDSNVKATVTKATEFAQTSPEPDPSELFTDILLPLTDNKLVAKV